MLGTYRQVAVLAARRAVKSWPVALSLVVYAVIAFAAMQVTAPLGMVGGFVMGFVIAACW
jgi:hypothetical protein